MNHRAFMEDDQVSRPSANIRETHAQLALILHAAPHLRRPMLRKRCRQRECPHDSASVTTFWVALVEAVTTWYFDFQLAAHHARGFAQSGLIVENELLR